MPRSRIITQEGGALTRRVAHLINTVTFDPPGMSPSAILLVRRLTDPLPRRLAGNLEAVRADSEWERAARNKLSEFHRRAVRPIHGFGSGAADAVVFSDQSEMLACLSRDIISGDATRFWWWRAILRGLPAGMIEALLAAWQRDARYVPSALHLLNARGEAVRVLSRFSPTQSWNILLEIAREFGISLPSQGGAPTTHVPRRPQEPVPTIVEEERGESVPREEERFAPAVAAPWHELTLTQAIPDSFGRERSALLGVSLLLHSAPQIARTARFRERFSAWYHHVETPRIRQTPAPSAAEPLSQNSAPKPPYGPTTISQLSVTGQEEATQTTTDVPPFDKQMRIVTAEEKPSSPGTRERTSQIDHGTEQPVVTEAVLHDWEPGAMPATPAFAHEKPPAQMINSTANKGEAPSARRVEAGQATSDLSEVPPTAEVRSPENVSPFHLAEGEPVPTELGGVLFLVNLLVALKLPELLETHFGVGPVSGWDLLELLARSLLQHREARLANDGVWSVLAQLAGRSPGAPVAAEFQPQQCYRIPSFWMDVLEPQGAQVFGVRLRRTHLQLWHPQGFILADGRGDRAVSQGAIEQECRVYCQKDELLKLASWRKIVKHALVGRCNAPVKSLPLQRFLAFLLPYVRWRLCLALGLTNAHALAETLLLRRGYLHATRTHLDLTMNLNQATAQVRMAGLDADPGWVPSLGRVIKFSFVTEGWG